MCPSYLELTLKWPAMVACMAVLPVMAVRAVGKLRNNEEFHGT